MLSVAIIEDEPLAAHRLELLLRQYDPAIAIRVTLPSIKAAVAWLGTHPEPDLFFMDLHLEDGLSVTILERTELTAPVILTTAFAEELTCCWGREFYAYLQKPIGKADLAAALDRWKAAR